MNPAYRFVLRPKPIPIFPSLGFNRLILLELYFRLYPKPFVLKAENTDSVESIGIYVPDWWPLLSPNPAGLSDIALRLSGIDTDSPSHGFWLNNIALIENNSMINFCIYAL